MDLDPHPNADPDPDPDSDFKTSTQKNVLFAYYFLKVHLHHFPADPDQQHSFLCNIYQADRLHHTRFSCVMSPPLA
jgi:hypothetical protein